MNASTVPTTSGSTCPGARRQHRHPRHRPRLAGLAAAALVAAAVWAATTSGFALASAGPAVIGAPPPLHWVLERSGTGATLDAVACGTSRVSPSGPTTEVCWAGGVRGTMLVSYGGRTWTHRRAPTRAAIHGLTCVTVAGTAHCFAVGADGTILESLSPWTPWHRVATRPRTTESFNGITCQANGGRCWAVGDGVAALGTPPASSPTPAWPLISIPGVGGAHCGISPDACLNGVAVASTDEHFAAGGGGNVFAQFDYRGSGWRDQLSLGAGYFAAIACSPSRVVGRGHCITVGTSRNLARDRIDLTFDSGARWLQPRTPRNGSLPALHGIAIPAVQSAREAYAVGDAGTILATGNGGTTWARQPSPTHRELLAVTCPSGAVACVAVGAVGTIAALTLPVPSPTPTPTLTPTPTPTPTGPRPLSACGTIMDTGSYQLTASLGPVSGTCLTVVPPPAGVTPGTTIDLDGHTITGDGTGTGSGIWIEPGASGVLIESSSPGAAISAFGTGVWDEGSDAVVRGPDLALTDNLGVGVELDGVNGSQVNDATVSGNDRFGIYFNSATDSAAGGNAVSGSGIYGVWIEGGTGDYVVSGNQVSGSGTAGIFVGRSNSGSLGEGTCASTPTLDRILGNTLLSNGSFGIAIACGPVNNIVSANSVSGDSAYDLADGNLNCGSPPNTWSANGYKTANRSVNATCIG